jgi:hypothetical protein
MLAVVCGGSDVAPQAQLPPGPDGEPGADLARASLILTPSRLPLGGTVNTSGVGYAAGSQITIRGCITPDAATAAADGAYCIVAPLATASAAADGSFVASIALPAFVPAGTLTITAIDRNGLFGSSELLVTP